MTEVDFRALGFIAKTAVSTRLAVKARVERMRRAQYAADHLDKLSPGAKPATYTKTNLRMAARYAKRKGVGAVRRPVDASVRAGGQRLMDDRSQRLFTAHLARKHGGKIVAGAAGLAALGAGGLALALRARRRRQQSREQT